VSYRNRLRNANGMSGGNKIYREKKEDLITQEEKN
jgi:hypothetical protein